MSVVGQHRGEGASRWPRTLRLACAGVFVAGGIGTLLLQSTYRWVEASVSAWLGDHVSNLTVWTPGEEQAAVIFVGRPVDLAFVITPACSSMIIAVLFFFGSAVLAVFAPRFRLRRILSAFSVAVGLAVLVNLARVVLIILASSEWSHEIGFRLSHEYVGSLITVFGMAVALLVYIVLLARDRSPMSAA